MTPEQFITELDISAACGDYLRSRYGAHRGHPEWRAMDDAFRAGAAWAQMNNSARNAALEEAAKVCESEYDNWDNERPLRICATAIRGLKA